MKSEKEKLAAKSVTALKASAKRLGGKLVTPDGKAKTKQQLINTIIMKQRLAGKSMGGNTTTKKVTYPNQTPAGIAKTKKEYAQLLAQVIKLENQVKAAVIKFQNKNKAWLPRN